MDAVIKNYVDNTRPLISDPKDVQLFDDLITVFGSLMRIREQWMCKKAGATLKSIREILRIIEMTLNGFSLNLKDRNGNMLLWVLMTFHQYNIDKKTFDKCFSVKGKNLDVGRIEQERALSEPIMYNLLEMYEKVKPMFAKDKM